MENLHDGIATGRGLPQQPKEVEKRQYEANEEPEVFLGDNLYPPEALHTNSLRHKRNVLARNRRKQQQIQKQEANRNKEAIHPNTGNRGFGGKPTLSGTVNPNFPQNTYNSTDSSGYNSSSTIDALEHAKNLTQTVDITNPLSPKSDTLNSSCSSASRPESMVSTDRRCSMGGHVPASEFIPYKVSVSQSGNYGGNTRPDVPKRTESMKGCGNKIKANNAVWQIRRPSEEIEEISEQNMREQNKRKQDVNYICNGVNGLSLGQSQTSFKIIPNPHVPSPSKNTVQGTAPIPAPRAIKYPPALPPKQNRRILDTCQQEQNHLRNSTTPNAFQMPDTVYSSPPSITAKSRHGPATSPDVHLSPIKETPTSRHVCNGGEYRVVGNVTVETRRTVNADDSYTNSTGYQSKLVTILENVFHCKQI